MPTLDQALQTKTQLLYTDLLNDIAQLEPDETAAEHIESCFKVCTSYWNKVSKWMHAYTFNNQSEEIHFFKHIKPMFTSQLEYYTLCYQAVLFNPKEDGKDCMDFWEHELNKIKLFYLRNNEFYKYYKNGKTHLDYIYFVRLNSVRINLSHNGIFNTDIDLSSSHDHLVTSLLAMERYNNYVKKELAYG